MLKFIDGVKQKCLKITTNPYFFLCNVPSDRQSLSTRTLSEIHSKRHISIFVLPFKLCITFIVF